MKHILLLFMLLPAILFAQKVTSEKVITLPFYDAKLPTDDITNMVWVDSADLKEGVRLEFENPDIKIASFSVITSTKGEIFKMGGLGNAITFQTGYVIDRAYISKAIITLHVDKIYLKGALRTANWTYRVRVR